MDDQTVKDSRTLVPRADGANICRLRTDRKVRLRSFVCELPCHLHLDEGAGFKRFRSLSDHLGSIDPDVKSVLFKNYSEHGAVHRENPRLHDLVLVLDELLVRLPRYLQPSDLNVLPADIKAAARSPPSCTRS